MDATKEPASRVRYSFGPFQLDPAERRLLRDGNDLRPTPKVFEMLVLLVEHHGLLVTKDDLMKALWPDMFVEEATLARNVSLLRKTLGDASGQEESKYIETVSKRGYRFVAEVTEVPENPVHDARPGSRKERQRWVALTAVGLLLAVMGGFLRYRTLHPRVEMHSLAVLPLENLSGNPDQEYFADGMTDELITNLAQIHSLRVISRTSVMQFKHTKKTLPEIARELNVDAVIEGTVSRLGNNVHVTAQLLDARQDRHLWAATYEEQMTDILGLQTQVAREIAYQVKANLTPEEGNRLLKHPSRNPDAYDALLKGRFLTTKRNRDSARFEKALTYYQQAVALDPNNAEAWAALGDCYGSLSGDLGAEDPKVMRPKAREAIAKALALDPELAEAYVASAWVKMFDRDDVGAERDFKRAIELDTNNSSAHRRYAFYLLNRKRFNEALEENGRAMDLAPLDIMPQILMVSIYANEGLTDKMIEQANRVLDLDPTYTHAYAFIAQGYIEKKQWPEAIAAYEHIKETDKLGYFLGLLTVWGLSGNRPKVEATMVELREFSRHNYVSPFWLAACEARFGSREQSLHWLQKAYDQHDRGMINLAENKNFENLRSDPRFQDLVRRSKPQ